MKTHRSLRAGFTLIELLVVIAIIGILASITVPVIGKALTAAKKAQAQAEIKTIETAVKAFYNDYSKYPHGNGNPGDYNYGELGTTPNHELMNVLRAINGPGNVNNVANPRRIVYIELPEKGVDENGNFIDPWQRQYEITLDTAFDNDCKSVPGGYGTLANRTTAVWSRGPEGENGQRDPSNDIKSW